MPSVQKPEGIQDPMDPGPVPGGAQEGTQLGDVQEEAGDNGEPQEPEEPPSSFWSSYKVSRPCPRPCLWLMGPPVPRYRFSSVKVW